MSTDGISNTSILLVEDNDSNRKVTMLMLARLGYKCDAVSNGLEAIRAFKLGYYDLVLMDIVMPYMDGLETTREIRKMSQNGLKIIGITAYVASGIKEKCLEAGMDDYIAKPVQKGDLAKVLAKYE